MHRFTKTEDFLMSLSVTIQGKLLEKIKKSDEKASNFAKTEKNKKNLSCYVKRIPLLDLFSKSIFFLQYLLLGVAAFTIFAKFAGFSRPFLTIFLSKSRFCKICYFCYF